MTIKEENNEEKKSISFVEQLVEEDLAKGKNGGRIQTRFPPEPNGYLHIGHAKAICMDFGVAEKYNGICNLRFDDTNPSKENNEYVENILNDIQWLGFKWGNIYYASDYFEKLWDFAIWMIKEGLAYVDEQTAEQIAEQKGTPTTPGTASPRSRPGRGPDPGPDCGRHGYRTHPRRGATGSRPPYRPCRTANRPRGNSCRGSGPPPSPKYGRARPSSPAGALPCTGSRGR